jgi:predicted O-methyltransferase YrrM
MDQAQWTAVDAYFSGLFAHADEALDAALQRSSAAGLPAIHVAPSQGRLLQVLALAVQAQRILEIGTLGGYSTIWLARGLPPGGRLITLERNPTHAAVAQANLAQAGLSGCVEVRVGNAVDSLQALVQASTPPFDLIFIDADKPGYPHYLAHALALSHPGTLIIADNVVRKGDILDAASDDPNIKGVQASLQMLSSEPRLAATAVQMVSSKSYDGFAIAVVRA